MNSLLKLSSWVAFLIICFSFFWLTKDIIQQGFPNLSFGFLTENPMNSGRAGGIYSIIISTLLILLVCMLTSIPIGFASAVFLSENRLKNIPLSNFIQNSLDILAGVPSIVFGLFGNVFFCKILGLGFSILSGGLTLTCMVLPIFIRSAEEGFRLIPNEQRLAAEALGLSKVTTLFKILTPLALPSLITGFILGLGRAIAETAALIFTSGYVDRTPESLFDSGRSLSIHIYDLAMNIPGGDKNAYTAALILLILVFVINEAAHIINTLFKKRIIV